MPRGKEIEHLLPAMRAGSLSKCCITQILQSATEVEVLPFHTLEHQSAAMFQSLASLGPEKGA